MSEEALDSFGKAPYNTTNAYIVWALTSSGNTDVDKQINSLVSTADKMLEGNGKIDTYFLSLVSASLYNLNRTDEAEKYADEVA